MLSLLTAAAILPSLFVSQAVTDNQVARQGTAWVRTASGTLTMPTQGRLQVSSRGKITVRGTTTQVIAYKLTQRVSATPSVRTEEAARAALGNTIVYRSPDPSPQAKLIVTVNSNTVATELELLVPKQLGSVTIEAQVGSVETYDLDGSVQVTTGAGELRADRISGGYNGRTGGGEIRLGKIGGTIRCSSGGGSIFIDSAGPDTNCSTMAGAVSVRESTGFVTLGTQGGNITVERAAATVSLQSYSGSIEVGQAGGFVTASTNAGFIQVGAAKGVRAETGLGSVRVRAIEGPMRLASASGSIFADLVAGLRLAESSLVASSGDITLSIPSNLAVTVMARNETGGNPGIVSDFSELRVHTVGFVLPPVVVQGSIGRGGPLMNLSTSGGAIYLRRVK